MDGEILVFQKNRKQEGRKKERKERGGKNRLFVPVDGVELLMVRRPHKNAEAAGSSDYHCNANTKSDDDDDDDY